MGSLRPGHRSRTRMGKVWAIAVTGALAALASLAPSTQAKGSSGWQVAWQGGAPSPAPLQGGRVLLPLSDLARDLGAQVHVEAGRIVFRQGAGYPPAPRLGSVGSVMWPVWDVGTGYVPAPPPAGGILPLPWPQPGRLAAGAVAYTWPGPAPLPQGRPQAVVLQVAEYSGADWAARAMWRLEEVGRTVGWPGISQPPPFPEVTAQVPPLGDADVVYRVAMPQGVGLVWLARVDNWVLASRAFFPLGWTPTANTVWPLWLMAVNRVERVPALPPAPAPVSGSASPPPSLPEAPFSRPPVVVLNGVALGQAVWTSQGYALPVGKVAQALELQVWRTGPRVLTLETGALGQSHTPPVVLPPAQALPSFPGFVPTSRASGSNEVLLAQNPSVEYTLFDLGRLGGYAQVYEEQPPLRPFGPQELAVAVGEFSTAYGAQAAAAAAARLLPSQLGAKALALGDLAGGGVLGGAVATRRVQGSPWRVVAVLARVDNWELLVEGAGPAATFRVADLWPYFQQAEEHLWSGGAPLPPLR